MTAKDFTRIYRRTGTDQFNARDLCVLFCELDVKITYKNSLVYVNLDGEYSLPDERFHAWIRSRARDLYPKVNLALYQDAWLALGYMIEFDLNLCGTDCFVNALKVSDLEIFCDFETAVKQGIVRDNPPEEAISR